MAKLIKTNFQLLMAKLRFKKHTRKENKTCRSPKQPEKLVPEGFFPIYVGEEHKRYVVPLTFLSARIFQALLNQFTEEIRAVGDKPITVPCSAEMFESILQFIHSQN
ncbi:Small auxin-up RNA [Trema orientale]|uniref:Small auxin-up RNA n=1 Tax=Trema orientale TaxID=63057 RepID=A0A2P5F9G2_TREOI|nr:Small auxin-up RNA [Trema orientale]